MLIPSHSAKSLRAMCYTALCARMCLEKSNAAGLSRDLKRQIFRLGKKNKKKTMRCEPPPVKRHTGGRPLKSAAFFFFSSPRDLVFELRAAGMEGQKWKETSAQSRCMYIPRFGSCQTCPGCVSSAPPSAIIHHAVTHTHTERGKKRSSCISAVRRASRGKKATGATA